MYRQSILAALFCLGTVNAEASGFTVYSPNITWDGKILDEQVFNGFGCEGKNVSPEINWQGAPEDTKSFAVTIYDPDAPTGSGWWHWVVFNISPKVTSLWQGAGQPQTRLMPAGAVQSMTDFGKPGYGGPCPPENDRAHRYEITVYALDTDKLPLNEHSTPAMVGYHLHNSMLEKSVVTAYYER